MATKINRDLMDPSVAVTLAREALAEYDLNDSTSLASYFPSQEVDDIEYEIERMADAGFITAANWRAFNGNTTSETWGAGSKSRGRFMPLSRNYTLDEEGALRMRNNPGMYIEREAANLIRRGAKAIGIAVNRARADILQNGKFTLRGSGGLDEVVDFGREPALTAAAGNLWTDLAAADPLRDIEAWVETYEQINGFRPEQMMLPSELFKYITKNETVIKEATGEETATRAKLTEINELLAELKLPTIVDMPNGLIKVDVLDEEERKERKAAGLDANNKIVHLFDRDSILFTPASGDPSDPHAAVYGRTLWGPTKTGDLPEFRGTGGDIPGIVAGVIEEGWPYNQEVIIDALAMPVAFNANYTMKVKVVENAKPVPTKGVNN